MNNLYTYDEISKHNNEDSCWIIINGNVYDVTKFCQFHPGGRAAILNVAGKDASKLFNQFHNVNQVLHKYGKLRIGKVKKEIKEEKEHPILKLVNLPKDKAFGDMFPYSDPNWYQRFDSPYYTDSHRKWRKIVRDLVESKLMLNVKKWEDNYRIPKEVIHDMGKQGLLAGVVGYWPKEFIGMAGPDNYDNFHELILIDEVTRTGSGGIAWGICGGLMIGLPPILNFGSNYIKQKVARSCLLGEKVICLAISEPWAGSDVAGLQTTAKRVGDYYIVNGLKKWITNAIFADFFTVAVRTGKKRGDLSLLLLEKDMPGISVKHMKCQGVLSSGTGFITFDNVKVPVSHLIGREGDGFKMMMYNFNHERWGLIIMANRLARVALEDSFKYAMERKTFGKRLIEHQHIRMEISEMARLVEATHAWLENVTYQMTRMSKMKAMITLGDTIALLKVQATKTLVTVAQKATLIFGGSGYVRGGKGERVERIYRDANAFSIPGGAESILNDFAIRSAQKYADNLPSKL